MSQDRVWLSKKSIAIFGNKYWVLSIDMKTKVVQHVPRINLSYFKFQIFKFSNFSNFQIFSGSQLLSDFQTFFWHQWFFFDKTFHLCFFWDHISTLSTDITVHRAGSQLKKKNPEIPFKVGQIRGVFHLRGGRGCKIFEG